MAAPRSPIIYASLDSTLMKRQAYIITGTCGDAGVEAVASLDDGGRFTERVSFTPWAAPS